MIGGMPASSRNTWDEAAAADSAATAEARGTERAGRRRYDGEGVRDLMRPNWRLRHQTE
jgi:hypothetical protein